jgi:hypothetical protein
MLAKGVGGLYIQRQTLYILYSRMFLSWTLEMAGNLYIQHSTTCNVVQVIYCIVATKWLKRILFFKSSGSKQDRFQGTLLTMYPHPYQIVMMKWEDMQLYQSPVGVQAQSQSRSNSKMQQKRNATLHRAKARYYCLSRFCIRQTDY